MTTLILAFAIGAVLIGLYALSCLSRHGWRRWAGPAFLSLIYGGMLWTGADILGHPKPAWLEMPSAKDAKLLAADLTHEGVAIYLWISVPWSDEPIAYRLPWDLRRAQQIKDAMGEAQSEQTDTGIRGLFDQSGDTEIMAYPMPQPARPPKTP